MKKIISGFGCMFGAIISLWVLSIVFPIAYNSIVNSIYNYTKWGFIDMVSNSLVLSFAIFSSILFILSALAFLIKAIQNVYYFIRYQLFNNLDNEVDHILFRTYPDGKIVSSIAIFKDGTRVPINLSEAIVNIEQVVKEVEPDDSGK